MVRIINALIVEDEKIKKNCNRKLESALFYTYWYACKMSKTITRNGEQKQQQLSYLSRVEKSESHFHLNRRLSLYQVKLNYLHSPPKFQSLKLKFSLIKFSNSNENIYIYIYTYGTCIHIKRPFDNVVLVTYLYFLKTFLSKKIYKNTGNIV